MDAPATAQRLIELRERAGLSQEKLADLVRSGRSTISKLESGERLITIEWMERLAPALACEPWDLLPKVKNDEQAVMEYAMRRKRMDEKTKLALSTIVEGMPLKEQAP